MATRVKFTGPDGMVNRDVGRETGGGDVLKPGKTYEVSAELAEKLVATAMWERPAAKKSSKSGSRSKRRAAAPEPDADAATQTLGEGSESVPGDGVEGDEKP